MTKAKTLLGYSMRHMTWIKKRALIALEPRLKRLAFTSIYGYGFYEMFKSRGFEQEMKALAWDYIKKIDDAEVEAIYVKTAKAEQGDIPTGREAMEATAAEHLADVMSRMCEYQARDSTGYRQARYMLQQVQKYKEDAL